MTKHRHYLITLIVPLAAVLTLTAQEVKLPAEVKGDPGTFVVIRAELSEGTSEVRWYTPDAGMQLFPTDLLKDSRSAVVLSGKAGKYRLVAWTAKGDVPSGPAVCLVTIGSPPPGPDPGPGPGPDPIPPPPPPPDPLAQSIMSAYAAEGDPTKGRYARDLAALYREAVRTVDDPALKTVGDLFRVLKEASARLLPATAITSVRGIIGGHLQTKLPTTTAAPLDTSVRATAKVEFARVAGILEGVQAMYPAWWRSDREQWGTPAKEKN